MIKIGFKACRMKTFKMKLENLPDVVYSISEKKIPYKMNISPKKPLIIRKRLENISLDMHILQPQL